MTKTVILHVGMTKAGSTAVQNLLEAHSEALLAQSVLFPKAGFTRADPFDPSRTGGHRGLLSWQDKTVVGELLAEFAASGADTLLISAENIIRVRHGGVIRRLAEAFQDFDVHLVAVLRDQVSWSGSRYYELVCKGLTHETQPIDDFYDSLLDKGDLDYAGVVESLRTIFSASRVSVLDYNRLTAEDRLVDGFLAACGLSLDLPTERKTARVNASSINAEGIEAHRRLNLLAGDLSKMRRLEWAHGFRQACAELSGPQGQNAERLLPSAKVRARILGQVEHFNRRLSATWLDGAAFGVGTAWYAQEPAPLDEDRITAMLDHGLRMLAEEFQQEAAENADNRTAATLGLAPEDADRLASALQGAQVILQSRPDALTLYAASLPDKLIFCLDPEGRAGPLLQDIYQARLPSPPIFVAGSADLAVALRQFWLAPLFRQPDLVLLQDATELHALLAVRPDTSAALTVLLRDTRARASDDAAQGVQRLVAVDLSGPVLAGGTERPMAPPGPRA